MQMLGFIIVSGERINVLVQSTKYGRRLKVRYSKVEGQHCEDEEKFLEERPDLVKRLKMGVVIHV